MAIHYAQAELVNRIIASLEQGVEPWRVQHKNIGTRQGRRGMPYNAVSGVAYRGMNVLQLIMTARPIDGGWLTFKQAKACGGFVRKGEKSTVIWYFTRAAKKERNAKGEQEFYPLVKSYLVFHRDQCEGIDDSKLFQFPPMEKSSLPDPVTMRIADADAFIDATNARYSYRDSETAFYSPTGDFIVMQPIEQYESADAFYSTFFHELTHWTGNRLGRNLSGRKGSKDYGYEELIAELTACFICPQFGLDNVKSNASYLNAWIRTLRENPQILSGVATEASKAHDFLCAFSELKGSSPAPDEGEGDDMEQAA